MKRGIVLLLCFMCLTTACSKQDNKDTSRTEKEAAISKNEVIWTIEARPVIPEENVEKLNQLLYKKGYDVAVRFRYAENGISSDLSLDSENPTLDYQKELEQIIQNRETDIVFCGYSDGSFPGQQTEFFRKGYFYSLNDWLETEEGKELYQLYDEEIWETSRMDGEIYSIPTEEGYYSDFVAAFNTRYIPEKLINTWDGSWKDLYRVIKQTKIPKDVAAVIGPIELESFQDVQDENVYQCEYDLFYDVKKCKALSPFEIPEFHDCLSFLNQCYRHGYLAKAPMYGLDDWRYSSEQAEDFEEGKYALALGSYAGAYDDDPEGHLVYRERKFCLTNNEGDRTAVCANSDKIEDALTLLKALRTDADLANTLIWGTADGKEILGEDGKVGEENHLLWTQNFGLYYGVFQDETSEAANMREFQQKRLQSEMRVHSDLAGFYPDYSQLTKEIQDYRAMLKKCINCWKEKDFEKAYQKAVKKMKPYEKALFPKLNQQIQDWEKENEKNRSK